MKLPGGVKAGKALERLKGEHKAFQEVLSARLRHWCLFLQPRLLLLIGYFRETD